MRRVNCGEIFGDQDYARVVSFLKMSVSLISVHDFVGLDAVQVAKFDFL